MSNLFSRKNKKNIINSASAELAQRVAQVKAVNFKQTGLDHNMAFYMIHNMGKVSVCHM